MKTRRLFYEDVYIREFEAIVLSCEERREGYYIILNETAFYPEGGGQPADKGTIEGEEVLDVQYVDGEICHIMKKPLKAGEQVVGRINWEWRFDLMQQHSGEHIVSGMIHEKYGYENVGFHMGEEVITIDLSGMLTEEQVAEIEQKVNDYIWMNQEVNIFYPDERQRKLIPYRSKKELTGEIRLVEFPGADLCACCGLHVTHASQIGLVKILSSKKFRDGVRMEMLSGKRALEYLSKSAEQNSQVAVRLSVKEKETKDAVQRLLDEVYNLKGELAAEKQKHFEQIAASCVGKENVLLIEGDMEPVEVRKCTDAILDTCSGVAAFFAGNDKDGYKYAIGQREGDVRELVKQVNKELNGRGGGKPFFAQGSLKATRKQIEIFFEKKVISNNIKNNLQKPGKKAKRNFFTIIFKWAIILMKILWKKFKRSSCFAVDADIVNKKWHR